MTTDPIRKRLQVRLEPDAAFRLFTTGIGSWWPLDSHPRAEDDQQTKDVVFEEHVGGRIYEIMTDGTEGYWGTVTAWEPPSRVVYDWRPSDDDTKPHTEVEVRFSPTDGGGTTVELEHRGWERLGADGLTHREAYASDTGWGLVLNRAFAEAAGGV